MAKRKIKINCDNIDKQKLDEIAVGVSVAVIFNILGDPDVPCFRLSKKSKVFSYMYGNVSFLSEDKKVISIQMDFHGSNTSVVEMESSLDMGLEKWLIFAEKQGYSVQENAGVIKILGKGISIGLSQNGNVGMISFN